MRKHLALIMRESFDVLLFLLNYWLYALRIILMKYLSFDWVTVFFRHFSQNLASLILFWSLFLWSFRFDKRNRVQPFICCISLRFIICEVKNWQLWDFLFFWRFTCDSASLYKAELPIVFAKFLQRLCFFYNVFLFSVRLLLLSLTIVFILLR